MDKVVATAVCFGSANGAGEENRNVARTAALPAGLPTSVPGVTEQGLKATGREPLARVSATGGHAVDPQYFGHAPVEAISRALVKAGRTFADLDVLELNEAFAAQVLDCLAAWPESDPAVLDPRGGASGTRLAGTVAHQLARKGSGTGVATLGIGVGQGPALVLER